MFMPVLGSLVVLLAALAVHRNAGLADAGMAPSRMTVLVQEEEECKCDTENHIFVYVDGCGSANWTTSGVSEPGKCDTFDTLVCYKEEEGVGCKGQNYNFSASAASDCCANPYGVKNGVPVSYNIILAGFFIGAPGDIECTASATVAGGSFDAKLMCNVSGEDTTIEHVKFVWDCGPCPGGIPQFAGGQK